MQMPMREIRKKYPKSTMVLLSWESRQKSYNMSKGFKRGQGLESNPNRVDEDGVAYTLPAGVNNGVAIQKKWFNEEGELDLRLATGEQACNYLRGLGVKIMPMIH